ncbi:DUF222 domain-containing protein [Williamsia sp. 1135]|uniref:HNH endonuclease n=1 Tax=Williamsia sp. 1135 TaxID=1889262 RepID=UPI000A11AFCD|nr:DUF222 domain-containing protein [Williamsia sp. 1135]ORM36698.1 HNH endonuclease [Williamsia sp. 1135]
MNIRTTTEDMIGLVVPDDPGDLASLTKDLITLRNATESQLSVCAAMIDRLGFAKKAGTTPSKWLQDNGAAPAPASRWLRIGAGVAKLDRTAGYFRDGFLSTEHVDAVVKGIKQINDRSDVGITDEERVVFEGKLLSHAISGARPTEIEKIAQGLGNQVAHDTGGPTPAEDPSLNKLDYAFSEGRLVGRFDVDAQIGEKLHAALDLWSRPRPEPDGSDDARSDTQRRADALHQLLDCGGGGGDGFVSAPRTEVNVSVPADHPDRATLEWMGPITEHLAKLLACDSSMASVILDQHGVPIDVGPSKRLFTGAVRKAIIIRDQCCVKCGGSASWSDCHHIIYWSDGGTTTLGNGCLLCRTCHRAIHNTGWEISMGSDGHPWLIPPADIDPQRRPLPAYNRRTMTLAA